MSYFINLTKYRNIQCIEVWSARRSFDYKKFVKAYFSSVEMYCTVKQLQHYTGYYKPSRSPEVYISAVLKPYINLLKPTGYVMHQ